jgi:hypothetical protein
MRYVLQPVAQQAVTENANLNLDLTHVEILDAEYAKPFLSRSDLERAAGGATEIALRALGGLYVNVYLPTDAASIRDDLEKALVSERLLVSLTIGGDLAPGDKAFFENWITGQRHAEDVTVWSGLPDVGLVIRR